MSHNLLEQTSAEFKKQMDDTKALVRKWKKSGLLEGLDHEYERHGMAIMLENQAKQLVREANSTGTAANSEQWSGVALPLVRRVFAEIAAKDFVSVQPMTLPSGLVFYMDFKYASAQAGFSTSRTDSALGMSTPDSGYYTDSLFGVTNTENDVTGGLYGTGRFGYSINDTVRSLYASSSVSPTTTTASISAALTMAADADLDEFNYDSKFTAAYSASIAAGHFKKVTVTTASLTNPDLNGVRAFVLTGSAVSAIFPQFTKISGGNITFIASGSLAAATSIAVQYQVQPVANQRGDFEDTTGNGTDIRIPELNVDFKSEPIVAKSRKLKTVWSPEFAQDLNAYHSIDAEAELTSMMSEYISQEIDLEILDMLTQNAVTRDQWSARIGYEFNANTGTFVEAGFTGTAYTQGTWFQTLGTKIQKVSNKIHQKTMRGGANFMVASPDVCTILESIPGYAADTNGDKSQFAMGVQKVGLLNNRMTVYKNPYITDNVVLLGYRGSQFLETGAVYAPYVPLIMTPLVYDPTNFTPRKGVMTRYAKKIVRPEFYGLVKIHGLDTI